MSGVVGLSGRPLRVDLYIPDAELYVDLDPLYTHQDFRAAEKDARKSSLLKHLNYVRLRAKGLPNIPGVSIIVDDATRNGVDPWTWATALRAPLAYNGIKYSHLSQSEKASILRAAAEAWGESKGRVRYFSVAEKFPELVKEFRRNLTNENFDLDLRSVSSNDLVEWECSSCQSVWRASIRNRTKGSGCHACYRKKGNAKNTARSMAPQGESVADLMPEVADRFIRCLTDPSRNPGNLRLRSNILCEWRCQTGLHVFTAGVFVVTGAKERRCCKGRSGST
ncbi:zinc-ribbon domain-containing protein [Nocardiopsis lambiniae]|uniref:Zinc-ribbon domain-containing protein n=1 Tax=Nocardiopsis lambiniae TaxID=3075539 RepID=A0ABU2MEJ6_9ACTN|nr:zinc-ribbon domain-containing protein [Nocardiopsis sp. DSM 44743]MDT0330984.1 zinc-ribbon domain-containing protein [Nocardiopsis sp. DSM 44743]